jgi:integrase
MQVVGVEPDQLRPDRDGPPAGLGPGAVGVVPGNDGDLALGSGDVFVTEPEGLTSPGLRAGELAGLDADAVVQIGAGHWLRIPLGKLRNDRYVPLHPELVRLLAAWTAANLEHIRRHKLLVADHRGPLDRHVIRRIIARAARAAGVPGVHPHRLRHTLATQAINRGMRLEAIAALLGHRKMEMTLIYANSRELHQMGENSQVA